MVVKTSLEAESQMHAMVMLCHLYGTGNVLSVTQRINEEGVGVLSPDMQRVKAMRDQAKHLQQQAKQIKAQNAVKKAQANLSKAKTTAGTV